MNFSTLGKVFAISSEKIFKWYRNVLSGFDKLEEQETLHEHDTKDRDLIDRITKKIKTVFVPIFKPENVGTNMAIDDKNIDGEGYTILSNKDTGKIALMIMSTKAHIICEVLQKLPLKIRLGVKTISKDLAENYDWVGRTMFWNAQRIADKFHVIKLAIEALQDVRIRHRQQILLADRKAKKANQPAEKTMLRNGDTLKQLLARSLYLLFCFPSKWTESQEERAKILFQLYPEIKRAYSIICSFRSFYNCKIGNRRKAKVILKKWYKKARKKGHDIPEILNFISSVHRHEAQILNYFDEGHTNAFAEALNRLIQKFIQSNYGVRDRDFFHFRLKKYFS